VLKSGRPCLYIVVSRNYLQRCTFYSRMLVAKSQVVSVCTYCRLCTFHIVALYSQRCSRGRSPLDIVRFTRRMHTHYRGLIVCVSLAACAQLIAANNDKVYRRSLRCPCVNVCVCVAKFPKNHAGGRNSASLPLPPAHHIPPSPILSSSPL